MSIIILTVVVWVCDVCVMCGCVYSSRAANVSRRVSFRSMNKTKPKKKKKKNTESRVLPLSSAPRADVYRSLPHLPLLLFFFLLAAGPRASRVSSARYRVGAFSQHTTRTTHAPPAARHRSAITKRRNPSREKKNARALFPRIFLSSARGSCCRLSISEFSLSTLSHKRAASTEKKGKKRGVF